MREFGLFSPEAVEEALNTIQTLEQFTDTFLEPFVVTSMMENGEMPVYFMSLHCTLASHWGVPDKNFYGKFSGKF